MNKKYHKETLQTVDKEIVEHSLGITLEFRIALEKLLIDGKLQGAAQGIVEQMLMKGKKSLSAKQLVVYEKYVIKKHKLESLLPS